MREFLRLNAPSGPALWLAAGRTAGFAATFVVPLVLVRALDQETFGTYKQLFLIYATLYGVAQLGAAESLYYFVPRRVADAGRHAVNAVLTLAAAGLLCAVALALLSPAIARWLRNPELTVTLPLLGVFLAWMLASAGFEIVLVARARYRVAAWTYGLSDVGRAALMLVPALWLFGLPGVLWGAVAFAVLRFGAMVWMLVRDVGLDLRPSAPLWRAQWVYTLPFALAVGLEVLQANFHFYVVAARFDPALFAIYAVGCLQIPLVDVLTTSSANVMMVRMAESGPARRAEALALWHDTMRRLALVIFPLVAFLLVAARDLIVVLFTSPYLASVPVFMVWTATIVFAVPCVDAVLRAFARTRALFVLNVVRLTTVAGLIGWGLSVFGLTGAAVVMLLATAIVRVAGVVHIGRMLGANARTVLPWRHFATTAACAAVAAAPAWWFTQVAPVPPLGSLAGAGAIYGLTYAALSFRLGRESAGAPRVPALQNVS